MRILFVPLALLLLALCSSATVLSWTSENTVSSQSTSNIISTAPEKAKAVSSNLGKAPGDVKLTEDQKNQLLGKMGNYLFFLALTFTDTKPSLYFMSALLNGAICEIEESTFAADIEQVAPKKPGDVQKVRAGNEEKDANYCTKTDDDAKCFCNDNSNVWECLGKMMVVLSKSPDKMEGWTKKPCRAAAWAILKETGTKTLAKMYDVDGFGKNDAFKAIFSGDKEHSGIDAITSDEHGKLGDFWCDALNQQVYDGVKGLFESDGLYWFADGFILALVFGPANQNLDTACKDSTFAASEYGVCVCKKETGFSFCIYKALAEIFKKAGFLTCPATPGTTGGALDPAKKSAVVLPSLAPPKRTGPPPSEGGSDGGSGTTGAATTATGFFSLALATVALLARQ